MYKINFQQPVHVHFIGIGGISMSGLAEILLKEGFRVSGSDNKESALTHHLENLGAAVFCGQKASNIISGINVIIYTAAIREDNEEYQEAKRQGLPMLSRAELLGQLMTNYATPVAVSGTHGKTTTTSMLSHILLAGKKDPTISVGGILKAIGGNIRVGGSEVFVTEACEYTNSFLHFFPKISIILNIDPDLNEITDGLRCRIITYGNDPSYCYSAGNISYNEMGEASFDLFRDGKYMDRISLSVGGEHNVSNALAAIAAAGLLTVPLAAVKEGLKDFHGTDRRFEYKGERDGVTVVDDYAHHPTEIRASLAAARNYPHRELWCVFQPHTYTRTKALFHEFVDALADTDHVILADIYAARETDTLGISSEELARALREKGCDAYYYPSFHEIEDFCMERCQNGDLLITMGAGDVVNIGEELLKR